MNHEYEKTKDDIRRRMEDYLETKGINISTTKNFNCLNPQHADSDPSMHYYPDTERVHCFGCNKSYDIFDLIGLDHGTDDFAEQLKIGCRLYGIPYPEYKASGQSGKKDRPQDKQNTNSLSKNNNSMTKDKKLTAEQQAANEFIARSAANLSSCDYLRGRGISDRTAAKYDIGYCDSWRHPKRPKMKASARLIIPTANGSYNARATDPDTDNKYRFIKYGETHPFNLKALEGEQPIYIVEGEIDALSVAEVGGEAIATGSTSNWRQIVEKAKKLKLKAPLILAFDNDDAGQRVQLEMAAELEKEKIKHDIYPQLYGSHKDANDALLADREGFTQKIKWGALNAGNIKEAADYCNTSTSNHINAFMDAVADRANTPAIPTGFHELDKILDGGLHPELIVMGAVSSLGKTTLMLQIADQIASQGKDVLYFSLEMSRYELMAKSISRHTAIIGEREGIDSRSWKTNRGITSYDRYVGYSKTERQLINDAVKEYSSYAQHLFINEGSGSVEDVNIDTIADTIRNHTKFTGRQLAAVFVDYLQIIPPQDVRASDKQNTDRAVFTLKRLSRELNIPIFAIASFNRDSYKDKVSMKAFKESGAIEYTSDLLKGLQFKGAGNDLDVGKAMAQMPREIELCILKNRNGEAGKIINYDYQPRFNIFQETGIELQEYEYNGDVI